MNVEELQLIANEAIVNITIGMIGLMAACVTYGIKKLTENATAQTALFENETARRKLECALSVVDRLVAITVSSVEQTTAGVLREAVRDGKADRKELTALAVGAKKKIVSSISPEAKRLISDNFGNFDDYVGELIEDQVLKLKTSPGEQEA